MINISFIINDKDIEIGKIIFDRYQLIVESKDIKIVQSIITKVYIDYDDNKIHYFY